MAGESYEVGAKGRDFATCPVCGGSSWCFVIFEGDSPKINCKREESSEVLLDGTVWRKVSDSPKLGTNYVLKDALDDFVRGQKSSGSRVAYRPKPKAVAPAVELKQQVLPPQAEVKLLSFELLPLRWNVVSQGYGSTEREIEYHYPSIHVGGSAGDGVSSEKASDDRGGADESLPHRSLGEVESVEIKVIRRQWDDRRSVYHKKQKADGSTTAKTKMILPKHRFPGSDWATGKPRIDGRTLDWPLYRWDEVIAHKPPVLCWAAGEKCVEALRGLGYVAVSQPFGENASEAAVVAVVRQVGQALIDGLSKLVLVFVDEDAAGIKFGNEVMRVASQMFPHRFLVLRIPMLGQMVNLDLGSAKNQTASGIPYSTCKNGVNDVADLIEILRGNQHDSLRTGLSALVAEVSKKNSKGNMTDNPDKKLRDASSDTGDYRGFEPIVSHVESLEVEGFSPHLQRYSDYISNTNSGIPGAGNYARQEQIVDPCKVSIGNAVVDTARLFDYSHKKGGEQLKPGSADGFARAMASATRGLAYDPEKEQWYTFASSGIWEPLLQEDLAHGVRAACHSIGSSLNRTFLTDACYFLSLNLSRKGWGGTDQVFFPNGKLDLRSGNFSELTEDDLCLQTLSFYYDSSGSTDCPQIRDFLSLFGGEVLVYGIAAALRKMGYLQRFIHLIGVPGSGKGTCLRLVRACLNKAAVSTTLENMENRFETAKFRDAAAILVPEGADVRIDPTTLKSLTGSDQVAYELKHAQQTQENSFVFTGIVFLATNKLPRWNESSAGAIKRRAIYLQLSVVPVEQKILLEFARNGNDEFIMGEFAQEIPQFFNWVMSLDKAAIAERMSQTNNEVDMGMFLESNPIAKWFDQCCVANDALNPRGKFILRAIVGTSQNAWSLYYSYNLWCDSTGEKPLNTRRFTGELKALLQTQSIPHDFARSAEGNTFYGICLAGEDSPEFPLSSNGDQWEEDE